MHSSRRLLWIGNGWPPSKQQLSAVDGPEPPDYMRSNIYQAARWTEAWRWRQALLEASRSQVR